MHYFHGLFIMILAVIHSIFIIQNLINLHVKNIYISKIYIKKYISN